MIKHILTIKPWMRKVLAALYLVLIALLSLLPTSNLPDIPYFSGEDKWIHFCMYSGLGFMACWSLDINRKRAASYFLLLVGVVMWGVLMEIMQRLMSMGRSLEVSDMLANFGGAVAGLAIYMYLVRLSKGALIRR
jgi:VanZ family protein